MCLYCTGFNFFINRPTNVTRFQVPLTIQPEKNVHIEKTQFDLRFNQNEKGFSFQVRKYLTLHEKVHSE